PVGEAAYGGGVPVEDVSVDHGRGDVAVPEEFLNRADVVAVFEQVRSERVPEGVALRVLGDFGTPHGALHRFTEDAPILAMPAPCAAQRGRQCVASSGQRRQEALRRRASAVEELSDAARDPGGVEAVLGVEALGVAGLAEAADAQALERGGELLSQD